MGCGPQGSSLLAKLGKLQAWEMSDETLQALVANDQLRRTKERALGRLRKTLEEQDDTEFKIKKGRPKTKSKVKKAPESLEGYGLPPQLCQKLRATGKPDWQLILELQGAGLL